MKNKEKLFSDVNKHSIYWDCYNGCPDENSHNLEAVKVCMEFAVSFSKFLCRHYKPSHEIGKWESQDIPKTYTDKQLLQIYLNSESA